MASYSRNPTDHETPRLAQLALSLDLPLVKLAVGRHVVATAPWVSGDHPCWSIPGLRRGWLPWWFCFV